MLAALQTAPPGRGAQRGTEEGKEDGPYPILVRPHVACPPLAIIAPRRYAARRTHRAATPANIQGACGGRTLRGAGAGRLRLGPARLPELLRRASGPALAEAAQRRLRLPRPPRRRRTLVGAAGG